MTLSIIDEAPYSRFHRKLVLMSAGGPFLDAYILTIIGIALGSIQTGLDLSGNETTMVGVASLVGLFVGGLGLGWVTDLVGRKVMYTLDLAALLIGSLLCFFVQEGWQLIAVRFALGIAIGADYPIATSMLSEWLPRKERGRCMGQLMAWWFVGACVASVVGYVMSSTMGDDAWRWVLASAAIPTAIVMIARHGTPESPRWCIANGQREQARASITEALGLQCTDADLDLLARHEARSGMGFWDAFRKPYGKRTLFVCVFWTFQIIPLFGLYTFGPMLLDAFGVSGDSLLGSVLISVMFLIGVVPGITLIDRVGRRPLIIWSFALMVLPLAVLGVLHEPSGLVVIACFSFYALASGGPTILEWAYPTELFPTEIRGTAVGVATSVSRIGAAVGTYLLPHSVTHFGLGTTMLFGAGLTLLGLLSCVAWAPETKGRSLTEASGAMTAPVGHLDAVQG